MPSTNRYAGVSLQTKEIRIEISNKNNNGTLARADPRNGGSPNESVDNQHEELGAGLLEDVLFLLGVAAAGVVDGAGVRGHLGAGLRLAGSGGRLEVQVGDEQTAAQRTSWSNTKPNRVEKRRPRFL